MDACNYFALRIRGLDQALKPDRQRYASSRGLIPQKLMMRTPDFREVRQPGLASRFPPALERGRARHFNGG